MRGVLAETFAPYSPAAVHRMVHGDAVDRLVYDLPVPGALAVDLLRQGDTDIPGGTQYTVNFVLTGTSELKIPDIQHVISSTAI